MSTDSTVRPHGSPPALVLIAEDDPTIASLVAAVVQGAGYATLTAQNGSEALALARHERPALVITDLQMPELDGTGLIAALHAEDGGGPPTILMTAAEPASWASCGADEVLRKPFRIAGLEALLTRFLPV